MTIMVTLKFPLQPGKSAAFLEALGKALPDTRAYAGCISVKTFADVEGGHVLLVEEWESKDHQQAYLAWRVETGLLDTLGSLLTGGPEVLFYEIRPE